MYTVFQEISFASSLPIAWWSITLHFIFLQLKLSTLGDWKIVVAFIGCERWSQKKLDFVIVACCVEAAI
jgi:hypothetical protein